MSITSKLPNFRRWVTLAAFCLSAGFSNAVTYHFNVHLNSGPLAGNVYGGYVETTPGDGLKTPNNLGLLSLNITVEGVAFSMQDDFLFGQDDPLGFGHDLPYVEVSGGQLQSINYLGIIGVSELAVVIFPAFDFNYAAFGPSGLLDDFGGIKANVSEGFVSAPDGGSPTAVFLLASMGSLAAIRLRFRTTQV